MNSAGYPISCSEGCVFVIDASTGSSGSGDTPGSPEVMTPLPVDPADPSDATAAQKQTRKRPRVVCLVFLWSGKNTILNKGMGLPGCLQAALKITSLVFC